MPWKSRLDVIHLLKQRGATVTFSDPYVPTLRVDGEDLFSADFDEALASTDCVVIITDHTAIDYQAVARNANLIVDTRNTLRGVVSDKIIRL